MANLAVICAKSPRLNTVLPVTSNRLITIAAGKPSGAVGWLGKLGAGVLGKISCEGGNCGCGGSTGGVGGLWKSGRGKVGVAWASNPPRSSRADGWGGVAATPMLEMLNIARSVLEIVDRKANKFTLIVDLDI